MADWIVVGGPEVFAKTAELGFSRVGFKSTRRNMAATVKPGDRLAFYVTGRKQFAGAVEVTSEMVEEHDRIWESPKKPNELYPFRVNTRPLIVVDESAWLDAEPYHEKFSWTQRWPRKNWTLAYQGNLHQIPADDFEMLRADLEKAASKFVATH